MGVVKKIKQIEWQIKYGQLQLCQVDCLTAGISSIKKQQVGVEAIILSESEATFLSADPYYICSTSRV